MCVIEWQNIINISEHETKDQLPEAFLFIFERLQKNSASNEYKQGLLFS